MYILHQFMKRKNSAKMSSCNIHQSFDNNIGNEDTDNDNIKEEDTEYEFIEDETIEDEYIEDEFIEDEYVEEDYIDEEYIEEEHIEEEHIVEEHIEEEHIGENYLDINEFDPLNNISEVLQENLVKLEDDSNVNQDLDNTDMINDSVSFVSVKEENLSQNLQLENHICLQGCVGVSFSEEYLLIQHYETFHEMIKPNQTSGLKVKIPKPNETEKLLKKHKCKILRCNREYTQKCHLNRHIADVHKRRTPKYKCKICPEVRFKQKCDLDRHISCVHEGEKPFKCDICESNFALKSDLNRHVSNVHEKKKPFECTICKSSFTSFYILKTHVETVHEKRKLFKCSECDQDFTANSSLKVHFKRIHQGLKPHKCSECDTG